MKNYKVIALFISLAFLIGCSGTQSYEEVEYTKPELKNQPRLLYPSEAQGRNYSGTSKVYLSVAEDGSVEKVTLLESSGHEILDNAALNYCTQMMFVPAKKDGKPVSCKIVQKVNFNLLDEDFSFKNYIAQIKRMYRLESNASDSERGIIQDKILQKYSEFIHKMSNVVSFNSALEKITLDDTCSDWENCWDNYPLTFLLYHDFIQRYPDYDSLEVVKQFMMQALESDLHFINMTKTNNLDEEKTRKGLVVKIHQFIKKNYPELTIKDGPLTAKLSS